MQINLFSARFTLTLNALTRPIGQHNQTMTTCHGALDVAPQHTLRIELLERIDSEDTRIKNLGQSNFPIIESDSFERDNEDPGCKFYVRFLYGDGNHPIIAPFGEKHPIVPAKKIKFIWEDAQSLEPFNRLTSDHAKETVSIFRNTRFATVKGFWHCQEKILYRHYPFLSKNGMVWWLKYQFYSRNRLKKVFVGKSSV